MRNFVFLVKKEKLLAGLFLAVLFIPCFVLVAIAMVGKAGFASAAPGNEVRWNISHESDYAGEYVDVRITTAENAVDGWGNMQFFISYDPSILELISPMVIDYHELGDLDGIPVLIPMSISRVAWGNYEFITETMTENVMLDSLEFDDVTFQTLIPQPEPLRRSITLTNHGNYLDGGGTSGIQFGAFKPTDPVVDKGYLFFLYQVPLENMTIHEPIIGTDFETVLRFRIYDHIPAGTVTPIYWEGVDVNIGDSRVSFATANPEDHGSVTVLGDEIPTYTIRYLPGDVGTHFDGEHTVLVAHDGYHLVLGQDYTGIQAFDPERYEFVGWELEDGTLVEPGTTLSNVQDDVTLHARWSVRTFTVTYLPGTHGVGTGGAVSGVLHNTEHTILAPDVVYISAQVGYRFVGWMDENGTLYAVNDSITVTEGMTLIAQWEIDDGSYTLTFYGNGGTPESQLVNVASDATYADAIFFVTEPIRDGYTFNGWFTAPIGGKRVVDTDSVANGPKVLYAQWTPIVPPELPLTEVHHAYLFGYGDYTIRPNQNITRAEVAAIFFRLITDEYRAEVWSKSNSYSDVFPANWFNNPVSTMTNAGVFTGLFDGTFSPNRAMTRGELAAVAARLVGSEIPAPGEFSLFSDTSGHWAETEINLIAEFNWVEGFGDGTFRPDDLITRAQVAAVINRMLGRIVESSDDLLDGMRTWSDNADPKAWYYLHIQVASNSADYVRIDGSEYIKWTDVWQPIDFTILEREDSEYWHIVTAREDWEMRR